MPCKAPKPDRLLEATMTLTSRNIETWRGNDSWSVMALQRLPGGVRRSTANTAEKLLVLAKFAEQNSANDIADAAYSDAINIGLKNREAYTGRLRLALAANDTTKTQTI